MSQSAKAKAEVALRAARARQRLLEKAEDEVLDLQDEVQKLRAWITGMQTALELVREGIRIGAVANVVVCPKGVGSDEMRLDDYLAGTLRLTTDGKPIVPRS